MSHHRRFPISVLLLLVLVPVPGSEDPQPFEALPPRPVRLPTQPDSSAVVEEARTIDRPGLAHDLVLLRQIRDRVRRRLEEGRLTGISQQEIDAELARDRGTVARPTVIDDAEGERIESRLFEGQLHVMRFPSGAARVTAHIGRERVQRIYTELLSVLLDRPYDDQSVADGRRRVSLHVEDMPWQQAVTVLLGQAGLGWRSDGDKVVIFPLDHQARQLDELRRLAEWSFEAARVGSEDADAAEAAWLLARQDQDLGHPLAAMRRCTDLIERFHQVEDRGVQQWVRRAKQTYADVLASIGEHREARSVYLSYIQTAPADDLELPGVWLAAAESSHALAQGATGEVADPAADERAVDLLQNLLAMHGEDPAAAEVILRARHLLGRLYFAAREWHSAREAFEAHAAMLGRAPGDDIIAAIADCNFALGRQAIAEQRRVDGDALFDRARDRYLELAGRRARDPALDVGIYHQAAYRAGLCAMERSQPDYIRALIDLIRARELGPEPELEVRIIGHIIRCYAELQREELQVREFFNLLEKSRLVAGSSQANDLMGEILGTALTNIDGYIGEERHKVLIDIAEARYREAQWNHADRANLLRQAIHTFRRVEEDAEGRLDPDLHMAIKIGLARAAMLNGDDALAERQLTDIIAVRDAHPREAALAVKLLLEHFRAMGRLDEALEAYRAYAGEGSR